MTASASPEEIKNLPYWNQVNIFLIYPAFDEPQGKNLIAFWKMFDSNNDKSTFRGRQAQNLGGLEKFPISALQGKLFRSTSSVMDY